jgi:hypothetical protein
MRHQLKVVKRLFFGLIAAFFFICNQLPVFASSLNSAAGFQVLNYGKAALSGTSAATSAASVGFGGATTSGAYIAPAVAVLGTAGLYLMGISAQNADSIRSAAASKYCAKNPNAAVCTGGLGYRFAPSDPPNSCYYFALSQSLSKVFPLSQVTLTQSCFGQSYNVPGGGSDLWYRTSSQPEAFPVGSPYRVPVPWNQWSQAERDAAIAGLSGSDIENNTTKSPAIALDPSKAAIANMSGSNVGGTAIGNSDGSIDAFPGVPASAANPAYNPAANPDTPANPADAVPTSPTITPIAPTEFTGENWLSHGINVFSNKFPFDIFGNLDNEGIVSNECPTYTFFEHPFELCPIKDFIVILKYPVIIGFTIRIFHSI